MVYKRYALRKAVVNEISLLTILAMSRSKQIQKTFRKGIRKCLNRTSKFPNGKHYYLMRSFIHTGILTTFIGNEGK